MGAPDRDRTPRRSDEAIRARIACGGMALVALSGGVDSAVVASLSRDALGPECVADTLSGPAVSTREVARARSVASSIGKRHLVLPVDPIARREYRENPEDRCYHCRAVETSVLTAFGAAHGVRQYLDGVHRDDLRDDRPGLKAMEEAGFVHPLAEAGWTKSDVREWARSRGLPNAEEPSDACLASRVHRGEPISRELLGRVEAAESLLLDRGFRRVRVRVRSGAARIEVGPDEVARLEVEPLATEITEGIRRLGFHPVTIDPRGYGGARLPVVAAP